MFVWNGINRYEYAISAIYQYAMDSNTFFAKILVRDVGLSQNGLVWGWAYGAARVFTWRAENDLGDIAEAYYYAYYPWNTLVYYVKDNIAGWAEDALVGILQ